LKISGKLYLLLACGLFGLILNVAISFHQLTAIKHSVDAITHDALPSMQQLSSIRGQLNDARRAVLKHVLAKGLAEKNQQRQAIAQSQQAIKAGFEKYRKDMISDEQDKANIEAAEQQIDKFFSITPNILHFSDQEQVDQARDLISKETTPASQAAAETLNRAASYNEQLAAKANSAVDGAMDSSHITLLVVAIATAVLLVIGGIWLVLQIKTPLETLQDSVAELASSLDFTQRIPSRGRDEISNTVTAVNHLLATMQAALTEIQQVGNQINGTAQSVASASQQMSQASQHVSESTANMSSAVEQMTVSVAHVAERAVQADGSGRQAGTEAQDGGTVIGHTIEAIRSTAEIVNDAAEKISALKEKTAQLDNVVGVIRDIADQTNLLALNAAIEAARAGDTGRGFAVVADEVRKLSERTATSTSEISSMIEAIQAGAEHTVTSMQQVVTQVDAGVTQASQATAAINRSLGSTNPVIDQVSEISGAMREQSQASTNIAQQIERVAQMTEETSASTQHTAQAAEDLKQEVHTLNHILAKFKVVA
jgi:methyl-accepting chemotaxis protein